MRAAVCCVINISRMLLFAALRCGGGVGWGGVGYYHSCLLFEQGLWQQLLQTNLPHLTLRKQVDERERERFQVLERVAWLPSRGNIEQTSVLLTTCINTYWMEMQREKEKIKELSRVFGSDKVENRSAPATS